MKFKLRSLVPIVIHSFLEAQPIEIGLSVSRQPLVEIDRVSQIERLHSITNWGSSFRIEFAGLIRTGFDLSYVRKKTISLQENAFLSTTDFVLFLRNVIWGLDRDVSLLYVDLPLNVGINLSSHSKFDLGFSVEISSFHIRDELFALASSTPSPGFPIPPVRSTMNARSEGVIEMHLVQFDLSPRFELAASIGDFLGLRIGTTYRAAVVSLDPKQAINSTVTYPGFVPAIFSYLPSYKYDFRGWQISLGMVVRI